ncbi:MAG: alpha/beta fold hydrolase, partial [Xanthobacteraceae bacterium]
SRHSLHKYGRQSGESAEMIQPDILKRRRLVALLAAFGVAALGAAAASAPAPPWITRQLLIPAPAADVLMVTPVLLPPRRAPFPLAVVNHGSTESEQTRAQYPLPSFPLIAARLITRGYAVALPQRPGHGETGGPYLESPRGCDHAHFLAAGHAAADSIKAAVDYLLRTPSIRKQPVVLVGQSAGAWGALALASTSSRVAAVINFAGGLGGRSFGVANHNCAPERLIAAAGEFGRTSRVPTLWFYAQNDSYFAPTLSQRMAEAYRAAGGIVDYRLLPPVAPDGHYLIYSPSAERIWGPIVDRFLAGLR